MSQITTITLQRVLTDLAALNAANVTGGGSNVDRKDETFSSFGRDSKGNLLLRGPTPAGKTVADAPFLKLSQTSPGGETGKPLFILRGVIPHQVVENGVNLRRPIRVNVSIETFNGHTTWQLEDALAIVFGTLTNAVIKGDIKARAPSF